MIAPLEIGNLLIKDERQYEIMRITKKNEVFLEDTFSKAKLKFSRREINDFLFLGQAELISSDARYNELHSDDAMDFHSYSESLRAEARMRYTFVRTFIDSGIKGCSGKESVVTLIKQISDEKKLEIISWRTLKRWLDAYQLYGIKGLIPNTKRKGNRTSRKKENLEKLILEALEGYKDKKRPTYRTAYEDLKDIILIHNHELKQSETPVKPDEYLDTISYPAFINRAKKIAPADLLAAYVGKSKVQNTFRISGQPDKPQYILDRAEIDHTTGDCFILDDVSLIPLGRPTVTAVLDKKSSSILGACIGFELPSFVSVGRAVKHAIMDKTEFLKQFPSVKNDWPCRGPFLELGYDRGAEFDGDMLEDALLELQIVGRANPAGMPRYKGAIESFFKTLNQKFLDKTPGKVLSNLVDSKDFDPEKDAVLTLSDFLEAFYVWIVDIYMQSSHGEDNTVPYIVWKRDERFVDIEPVSAKKLTLAFSQNLTRKNNTDGIVYEYIKYDNDMLYRLRRQYGHQELEIKLNREDLSEINVLHPVSKKYFPVEAIDQEYTKALTHYQHRICRKYREKLALESVDEVSLAYARRRIAEIISQAFSRSKRVKIAYAKVAARFNDLGQHKIGENTNILPDNRKQRPPEPNVPKGDVKPKKSMSEFLKDFQKGK